MEELLVGVAADEMLNKQLYLFIVSMLGLWYLKPPF